MSHTHRPLEETEESVGRSAECVICGVNLLFTGKRWEWELDVPPKKRRLLVSISTLEARELLDR